MDSVYLDHAATTPLRGDVVAAMEPYASEVFGNPSSVHGFGRRAQAALDEARREIAEALGARPSEIRFVRGGTESDNLAVLGYCRAGRARWGSQTPLYVSSVEHSAVLEAAEHAEEVGDAALTVLATRPGGSLDLEPLRSHSSPSRGSGPSQRPVAASGSGQPLASGPSQRSEAAPLVSVMWVNNETGMVLPMADVVEAARASGAVVHSDASQALGKVPVSVTDPMLHLLTATGHKIGGPRGMGILFVREGVELTPLLHGGGQERGLRPGTEDVAGAVGLAAAIRLAVAEQEEEAVRLEALRERLEAGIRSDIPGVRINCGEAHRSPHVSSVGIPGIPDGETLLMALDLEGVAVSGGSACHSGAGKGSHVIAALYGPDDPMTTVRFSLGRDSSPDDVDRAVAATATVVGRLRPGSEDAA